MNKTQGLTKVITTAASMLVFASLSGCAGGDGTSGAASGDWYYHWNCNGDPECVSLTAPGQNGLDGPSGTHNEGPVYANCSVLLKFASINWNIPPATNSCDHSPTGGGTGGAGDGAGVGGGAGSEVGGTSNSGGALGSGGTMSLGGAVGSGGTMSPGGAVGSGGTMSPGGAVGSGGRTSSGGATSTGGTTAVCVLSACPSCLGPTGALCGGGDTKCCTPQATCGCCTSSLGMVRCE